MAVGVTGQTEIDNAVRTFVAEAVYIQEHKGVMARLVDTKSLPKKQGRTWNEPVFPTLTAQSLTDGVAINNMTQLSDATIQITPGEVGLQVLFTRRMNDTITEDFMRIVGDLTANAVEYKRDTDLVGQLDSFGGVMGSTTTTLTAGLIGAALASIRSGRAYGSGSARTGARTTGDPGEAPFHAVFHEFNRYDLAAQMSGLGGVVQTTTGAAVNNFNTSQGMTELNAQWIREHYVMDIHGAGFYVDNNFTISSSAIKGGVFAKKAIVHVKFRGFERDVEWDSDYRGWKITVTEDYGWGERNDVWGIEVDVDATAPTT